MMFIQNVLARRRTRNVRRKTLITKAHELSVMCGGSIIIIFDDGNDKRWVYSTNNHMWDTYCTTGKIYIELCHA